ncbi:hypothetical protein CLCR_06445 [Cladophialophora carrionii]|uniref:Uncharacterized protein n=1 Tax=Cladophialophora carrionii TaxID=86049 RepID=A0A1C1CA43_9EURO|nr:hypothetical protein CLCR_06445 [Cladophialophora carrionii]
MSTYCRGPDTVRRTTQISAVVRPATTAYLNGAHQINCQAPEKDKDKEGCSGAALGTQYLIAQCLDSHSGVGTPTHIWRVAGVGMPNGA